MKPEIKAMLPKLPETRFAGDLHISHCVILLDEAEAWLEKLTEGASIAYGIKHDGDGFCSTEMAQSGDTHTALLICPREIDNRVSLSELVEYLQSTNDKGSYSHSLADRLEKFGVAP